jgi:excisionase family DNA binding protein
MSAGELLDGLVRLIAKHLALELRGMASPPGRDLAHGLTLNTAAARLGVSRATCVRLVADGGMRAARVGRRWIVPETEIARLLSASTAPTRQVVDDDARATAAQVLDRRRPRRARRAS